MKDLLLIITFIAIWAGCTSAGGVLGFIFGWLPGSLIATILFGRG